jgi:hypothetical protein
MPPKILAITCDNASNNDTMIEELAVLIESFPGTPNRTCCFNHIINLIAKTVIQQFDIQQIKTKPGHNDAEQELLELAVEIDIEELVMLTEHDTNDMDSDDDTEGWVDEQEELSNLK